MKLDTISQKPKLSSFAISKINTAIEYMSQLLTMFNHLIFSDFYIYFHDAMCTYGDTFLRHRLGGLYLEYAQKNCAYFYEISALLSLIFDFYKRANIDDCKLNAETIYVDQAIKIVLGAGIYTYCNYILLNSTICPHLDSYFRRWRPTTQPTLKRKRDLTDDGEDERN